MIALFETIKLIFFIMTILLALLMTKGEYLLGAERATLLSSIALPGYLLLIGVMMGYVIALGMLGNQYATTTSRTTHIMTNMFLVGIVLGIMFALSYIFVF